MSRPGVADRLTSLLRTHEIPDAQIRLLVSNLPDGLTTGSGTAGSSHRWTLTDAAGNGHHLEIHRTPDPTNTNAATGTNTATGTNPATGSIIIALTPHHPTPPHDSDMDTGGNAIEGGAGMGREGMDLNVLAVLSGVDRAGPVRGPEGSGPTTAAGNAEARQGSVVPASELAASGPLPIDSGRPLRPRRVTITGTGPDLSDLGGAGPTLRGLIRQPGLPDSGSSTGVGRFVPGSVGLVGDLPEEVRGFLGKYAELWVVLLSYPQGITVPDLHSRAYPHMKKPTMLRRRVEELGDKGGWLHTVGHARTGQRGRQHSAAQFAAVVPPWLSAGSREELRVWGGRRMERVLRQWPVPPLSVPKTLTSHLPSELSVAANSLSVAPETFGQILLTFLLAERRLTAPGVGGAMATRNHTFLEDTVRRAVKMLEALGIVSNASTERPGTERGRGGSSTLFEFGSVAVLRSPAWAGVLAQLTAGVLGYPHAGAAGLSRATGLQRLGIVFSDADTAGIAYVPGPIPAGTPQTHIISPTSNGNGSGSGNGEGGSGGSGGGGGHSVSRPGVADRLTSLLRTHEIPDAQIQLLVSNLPDRLTTGSGTTGSSHRWTLTDAAGNGHHLEIHRTPDPTNTNTATGTNSGTNSDTATGTNSGTNSDTATGTNSGTNPATGSIIIALTPHHPTPPHDTNSDSNTETETDTDSNTDTGNLGSPGPDTSGGAGGQADDWGIYTLPVHTEGAPTGVPLPPAPRARLHNGLIIEEPRQGPVSDRHSVAAIPAPDDHSGQLAGDVPSDTAHRAGSRDDTVPRLAPDIDTGLRRPPGDHVEQPPSPDTRVSRPHVDTSDTGAGTPGRIVETVETALAGPHADDGAQRLPQADSRAAAATQPSPARGTALPTRGIFAPVEGTFHGPPETLREAPHARLEPDHPAIVEPVGVAESRIVSGTTWWTWKRGEAVHITRTDPRTLDADYLSHLSWITADQDQRSNAYHEASHAIAALATGKHLVSVSIIGGADHGGQTTSLTDRNAKSEPLVDAAGERGQLRHLQEAGLLNPQTYYAVELGAKGDRELAVKHDSRIRFGEPSPGLVPYTDVQQQTDELLDPHWPAIIRVAAELEVHKMLSGDRVSELAGLPNPPAASLHPLAASFQAPGPSLALVMADGQGRAVGLHLSSGANGPIRQRQLTAAFQEGLFQIRSDGVNAATGQPMRMAKKSALLPDSIDKPKPLAVEVTDILASAKAAGWRPGLDDLQLATTAKPPTEGWGRLARALAAEAEGSDVYHPDDSPPPDGAAFAIDEDSHLVVSGGRTWTFVAGTTRRAPRFQSSPEGRLVPVSAADSTGPGDGGIYAPLGEDSVAALQSLPVAPHARRQDDGTITEDSDRPAVR